MAEQTIETIPRGNGEEIRVSLSEYKGSRFLNLRTWFRNARGQMQPGKKGLTVPMRLLPDFARAVSRANTVALQRGELQTAEVHPLFKDDADFKVIER
ncbi:transcriptional coactivator p15/PC4 family protein (plasmid) [Roseivivax marinus]|uniref:transcriptional coactivator p15/PC4 family protein n=1 Tax=Roseivivax marinus TaxID=1379903 RepID=UPI001F03EE4F|nr:transcriptional coactivator p15/PC4 family protein [Roseivivax marinus]UMA67280.1 transcriptional coactivator p15/PC4 family protein [Roseivivax marinus]